MYVYDIGYMLIYLLFYLMYKHAIKHAEQLELTPYELFETSSQMNTNLINVMIGLLGIIITIILPGNLKGASGYTYLLIPFAYSIFFSRRTKKSKRIFGISG
ncbi:MAG: hypothetical protein ACTHJ8_16270 [Mucilaginibacter sp.]